MNTHTTKTRAGRAWAQIAFKGPGEYGRMLTAVVHYSADGDPIYQCGGFSGSLHELEKYIGNGAGQLRSSLPLVLIISQKLLTA